MAKDKHRVAPTEGATPVAPRQASHTKSDAQIEDKRISSWLVWARKRGRIVTEADVPPRRAKKTFADPVAQAKHEQMLLLSKRSKSRKSAIRAGIEPEPFHRVWAGKRPAAKTDEERAIRKIERRERNRISSAQCRAKNPERRRKIRLASAEKNRDEKNAAEAERSKRPEEKVRRRRNKIARLANSVQARISESLRSQVNKAMRRRMNSSKRGIKTMDLIGCSVAELMVHLESLFRPGMSWENYGFEGWHVDHKTALATFDLTDPEQVRIALHWTNLQPLWGRHNSSKGSRSDWSDEGLQAPPDAVAYIYKHKPQAAPVPDDLCWIMAEDFSAGGLSLEAIAKKYKVGRSVVVRRLKLVLPNYHQIAGSHRGMIYDHKPMKPALPTKKAA